MSYGEDKEVRRRRNKHHGDAYGMRVSRCDTQHDSRRNDSTDRRITINRWDTNQNREPWKDNATNEPRSYVSNT